MHLTETIQFISMLSWDTGKVQPEVPEGPIISGVWNKRNSKKYPVAPRDWGMLVFPNSHNKFVKK